MSWRLALLLLFGLCACDSTEPEGVEPVSGARFAVLRTDYESTAVAALGPRGRVLAQSFVSSASQAPELVAPLSGDVVLAAEAPGVLALIDRFGSDVLTRLDLEAGAVLAQLRLSEGTFPTNPHAWSSDGSLGWVSRHSANPDPSAEPWARGNDLVQLELDPLRPTGLRVDLSALTATVAVETDEGMVVEPAYARPSAIVRVGDRLVVGLARLSLGFDGAARGAVAVVDPATGAWSEVELPESARNCGGVEPTLDAEDEVWVVCTGFSLPFGAVGPTRATAGVYRLRFQGDEAEIVGRYEPRAPPDPLAVYELAPLSEGRFLAVAYGRLEGPGDEAYVVGPDGSAQLLFASSEAFAIGKAAFDPETGLLVVPDAAGAGELRVFEQTEAGFRLVVRRSFDDRPLPPRAVLLLP